MDKHPPPRMRRHVRGQYVVRIRGTDYWLGTDEAAAREQYDDLVATLWVPARQNAVALRRSNAGRLTVAEAAELMCSHYDSTSPPTVGQGGGSKYWRTHLARWVFVHGDKYMLELATPDPSRGSFLAPVVPLLNAMAADLATTDLAPKTIKHNLDAVRRLFHWCAEHGLGPRVDFGSVKTPRLPRRPTPTLTNAQVSKLLKAADRDNPRVTPWLAITYLCACRPSETVTLVRAVHANDERATGQWVELIDPNTQRPHHDTVFALDQHKTQHKVQAPRFVIVPPTARQWLERARPWWRDLRAYTKASKRVEWPLAAGCTDDHGHSPKMLQRSAASHLRASGVAEAEIETALGHVQPGEFARYARASLAPLAARMESELALRYTPQSSDELADR